MYVMSVRSTEPSSGAGNRLKTDVESGGLVSRGCPPGPCFNPNVDNINYQVDHVYEDQAECDGRRMHVWMHVAGHAKASGGRVLQLVDANYGLSQLQRAEALHAEAIGLDVEQVMTSADGRAAYDLPPLRPMEPAPPPLELRENECLVQAGEEIWIGNDYPGSDVETAPYRDINFHLQMAREKGYSGFVLCSDRGQCFYKAPGLNLRCALARKASADTVIIRRKTKSTTYELFRDFDMGPGRDHYKHPYASLDDSLAHAQAHRHAGFIIHLQKDGHPVVFYKKDTAERLHEGLIAKHGRRYAVILKY